MCSSFKGASSRLCEALARFARLLASTSLDPAGLAPFLSCRLIALNKNPGVRPIGVCGVIRRIIAKAILKVVRGSVEEACGLTQKCSGLPAGIEAAAHAMQQLYDSECTEGVLLVDASNAFNSLNRNCALHNIQRQCPALARTLLNCYQSPARLFVAGGGELSSQEGVTQGDPLSMVFYALATLPLIGKLRGEHPSISQAWYADDSGGAGQLQQLRGWWDSLERLGPEYGYFTNSTKTQLLVKPSQLGEANRIFDGTGIRIVTGGVRYLGTALGESQFIQSFFRRKVDDWIAELTSLAGFAETEPHAAHAALTHGLKSRWTYILRTMPTDAEDLRRLDDTLVSTVLPRLTGRQCFSRNELAMLRLPVRLGGMAFPHLAGVAEGELTSSKNVTHLQTQSLLHQTNAEFCQPSFQAIYGECHQAKLRTSKLRRRREKLLYGNLLSEGDIDSRRLSHNATKGASSWLSVLPLREHGFWLSRDDFRDAICLRYDWQLPSMPTLCICGEPFSVVHAMSCPTGGYPTIRHNELRDQLAATVTEVCHSVAVEPLLAPVEGERFLAASTTVAPEARSDFCASGFWTRGQMAHFDVRVFHADAPSYADKPIADLFRSQERQKKLKYEERIINVEHASFCPLIFSTTGAAGPSCTRFISRLASLLADHNSSTSYSCLMSWIRCRLSFALIRSAILCIRGSRSSRHRPVHHEHELAVAESRLQE